MISAGTLLRAPSYSWEVEIHRKRTLNEYQNSRKIRRPVIAPDEASAKNEALRGYPEFVAVSVRKVMR